MYHTSVALHLFYASRECRVRLLQNAFSVTPKRKQKTTEDFILDFHSIGIRRVWCWETIVRTLFLLFLYLDTQMITVFSIAIPRFSVCNCVTSHICFFLKTYSPNKRLFSVQKLGNALRHNLTSGFQLRITIPFLTRTMSIGCATGLERKKNLLTDCTQCQCVWTNEIVRLKWKENITERKVKKKIISEKLCSKFRVPFSKRTNGV